MSLSLEESISSLAGLKIVIDLTPMLPGGENGGAKLMTLALIAALAELLPETTFLLLTAESSHAELDHMEHQYANIERLCVLFTRAPSTAPSPVGYSWRDRSVDGIKAILRRFLPFLVKVLIKRWLNRAQPAPGSSGLLREAKADLLFCPFTAPFYADSTVPTVSIVYDLQYRSYPQFFSPDELYQREEAFKAAYQEANHLVAISEYVKGTVIEASGLPSEKVSAVTLGLFRPPIEKGTEQNSAAYFAKYNLIPGEYILYPANFWEHKNHEMLLTAFGMVLKAVPNRKLKLVCTGAPGSSADLFCEKVERMGLVGQVIYPGFVSAEAYGWLLNAAFALIFPSLYEGFGIPVLEAMAAGVPVLCSNVTSLPEVGGEAVLYFDPRKPADICHAIERLTDEQGLREKLIASGIQRSFIFAGSERMAKEYAPIFAHVRRDYSSARRLSIQGVYADGWTGNIIEIGFPAAETGQTRSLSIALENPAWIKTSVKIQARYEKHALFNPVTLKAGMNTRFDIPLPDMGGVIDIEISPTFNPSNLGISKDNRELGLHCQSCEVNGSSGRINLLSEREIS